MRINSDPLMLTTLAHPENSVLQAEHVAAMSLAAVDQATHIAVASGPWTSPDTWKERRIPTQGSRVLIPAELQVEIATELQPALEWVRVNGELFFAADVNTALNVDTLVTAPGSRLEIGTPQEPIRSDVRAEILFADLGPLDVRKDPMLLGRGAILHGTTVVHGSPRSSALPATKAPRRGDRHLHLADRPTGWSVGDQLVIAGTSPNGQGDETVQIHAIEGATIQLQEPLTRDHIPPRDSLRVHVANLSRNVVFRSENKAIDRRGHVMFMHTRDVDVANAAFNDLGRTDKLRPINSPYFDENGDYASGTGSNPGGRYSVHFHRNGVERTGQPAVVKGSVVSANPGWGFVNHSSYVNFIDNVAYDVTGAAFSTEAGDEIGSFENNIAIRMHGTGDEPITRQEEGDFGHAGDGFWLQGPGVRVENNVVSGATGSGFILYAEPLFEDGLGITTFPSQNLQEPDRAAGAATIPVSLAPLATFKGNEAYGSALGAQIYYHRTFITIEEEQEEQAALKFPPSLIEDMDLWSNSTGMLVNYTVDTNFKDIRIVGPADGTGDTGFDAASNFYNRGTHQYKDLSIEDYEIGFSAPRSGKIDVIGGYFNNITDIYINEPRQIGRRLRFSGDLQFGDRPSGVAEGELIPRTYFDLDPEFAPAADSANEHFLLDDQILLDFGPYQNQQLYFYQQEADHVLFPKPPSQLIPDDPGPTIGQEFIGVSNAQIHARLKSSFGGAIAPEDAQELNRILGLVGSPVADRPALNANPLPMDDEIDEDDEFHDERELELGLPEEGGRTRLILAEMLLLEHHSERDTISTEGHDLITLFGSDRAEKIDIVIQPDSELELDEVVLFAEDGNDRVILRERDSSTLEFISIHGESGNDRLDARRFKTAVELDGGQGKDVLIGGAAESELWGGAGRDKFKLRAKRAGLQVLMDFDPYQDRLRFSFDSSNINIQARGDDLWLLKGEQTFAILTNLSEEQDVIRTLIS